MKDPAVLVYIDKWIAATQGMKGNTRGWYFDLLIYQYDHRSIPNDFDTIAGICRVQPSEYKVFKQVFEQKLIKKFNINEQNELENPFAAEIISKRKEFIKKRSNAGKVSYLVKYGKNKLRLSKKKIEFFKKHLNVDLINENELKDESFVKNVFKQVFEHTGELYINVDEDVNKNKKVDKKFKPPTLKEVQDYVDKNNYQVDPEDFINFYTSKDWMIGKNKMKDWKAAIRTWVSKDKKDQKEKAAEQKAPRKVVSKYRNLKNYEFDNEPKEK